MVVRILEKRLDARTAIEFKESIEKIVREGNQWIVLNIGAGEFMDSSFLFVLVSSLRLIWRDGCIVISDAGDTVKSLLTLTKMDKVFQMFADEETAVKFLST